MAAPIGSALSLAIHSFNQLPAIHLHSRRHQTDLLM